MKLSPIVTVMCCHATATLHHHYERVRSHRGIRVSVDGFGEAACVFDVQNTAGLHGALWKYDEICEDPERDATSSERRNGRGCLVFVNSIFAGPDIWVISK
jgi:hypothetical protein